MLKIVEFAPRYEAAIIELIVSIQRDEFGIEITAEEQPDLRSIPSFYQIAPGNFWVAIADEAVVGTISLLDLGGSQVALRKMFVHPSYRGSTHGVARELLRTLLSWAESHGLADIYLGTTAFFHAAHRFYEKNGFRELPKAELPASFPIMKVDTKFYHLRVPRHDAMPLVDDPLGPSGVHS